MEYAASRAELLRTGSRDHQLRRALATGELSRPVHGGYAFVGRGPMPVDGPYVFEHHARFLEAVSAAASVLPADGAFAGRTAAYLLCGLWPDSLVPEVVVPPTRAAPRRRGVHARQALLDPIDLDEVHGFPCTSALRTATDLARREGPLSGLIALDALTHAGLVTREDILAAMARPLGRGVLQLRRIAPWVDGGAESPGETAMRYPLAAAGVGPLQTQVPVLGGRYRVDLVVNGRVLCEFEGRHHDAPTVAAQDRVRFNELAAIPGTSLLRFDSDSVRVPAELVRRVTAALHAGRGPAPTC